MVEVADLADRRVALEPHAAELPGREPEEGVLPFLRHQLDPGAGGARELRALAGLELDRVDDRAQRNQPQGKRVARQDVRRRP